MNQQFLKINEGYRDVNLITEYMKKIQKKNMTQGKNGKIVLLFKI